MNNTKILLKNEVKNKLKIFSLNRQNIKNGVLSLFLMCVLIAVSILIFGYFTTNYLAVKINYQTDILARSRELFALVYLLAVVCSVIISAIKISNIITNQGEIKRLMVLPISTQNIFWVKMFSIAVDIVYVVFAIAITLGGTICVVAQLPFYMFIKCFISSIVLSIFSFGVGAIFALPYYYIKRFFKNKFYLTIGLFVLIIIFSFFVYSQILDIFKQMLESGQIKFLLNEQNIILLQKIGNFVFVCKVLSNFTIFLVEFWQIFVILTILALCFYLAYLIVKYVFNRVLKSKFEGYKLYAKQSVQYTRHSQLFALIKSEYISILREPSFAFQYFVIGLTLPFFVYSTSSILVNMMKDLIFIDCTFEICLFCSIMFTILTNTFCATNISRDGSFFNLKKTMPINAQSLVISKVLFCFLVSTISIALTSIIMLVLNVVSFMQSVVLFVVLLSISFGEICLATKQDFKNPSFSLDKSKATPTVNFVVFWGFVVSVLIGGATLYSALFLSTIQSQFNAQTLSFVFAIVVAGVFATISYLRLKFNLNKKILGVVCNEK